MVAGPQDGHRRAHPLRAAETERFRALNIWLHTYSHQRAHTGLGGQLAGGRGEG